MHLVYELCFGFRMTTKTVAEDEKDMPTSSVIMMKASTVSDDTFSFPQNDNMQILIEDEKATSAQDRQAMEVLFACNLMMITIIIIIFKLHM